ncbi:DUF3397 family protein [Sediminibacillus dalangtanensis]|uniref:DUF3397 family protein n=1 Tax=Sediminibacillus dalangtanensis TaxID=2729421 RepID=A0ABX7VXJ8_9BACI|nr:DUF3397 family protein [Sediminibacillus dalangtanensis]QTM99326.1 DUF3397 family protein [Sediminibacillus dalangtanensis]
MIDLMVWLLAFCLTMPIVISWLMYIVVRKVSNNRLKALHVSVNYTTLLYILSVGVIFHHLYGTTYYGYIFIFLIVLLSFFIIMQYKVKGEVLFLTAWRRFWRLSFLLFTLLYFLLVLYGITAGILAV